MDFFKNENEERIHPIDTFPEFSLSHDLIKNDPEPASPYPSFEAVNQKNLDFDFVAKNSKSHNQDLYDIFDNKNTFTK